MSPKNPKEKKVNFYPPVSDPLNPEFGLVDPDDEYEHRRKGNDEVEEAYRLLEQDVKLNRNSEPQETKREDKTARRR